MKKSLLALAVLGALSGVASAQSSVTLFGIVDVNARYVKNDGQTKRYSLSQDGINSSRFGVRGVEDLGGGLKAGFHLEGGVNADTGTASATKFWGRKAVASLSGNFGEVRLGRDYTPSFINNSAFDAFGTNGLGSSEFAIAQILPPDAVRADNSIGYFLPSGIGGVYGQAMVAAGEGAAAGRYVGGRVGFAAGPFDVAVSYAQENVAAGKIKSANVGGSYDLGVVKLLSYFNQEKQGTAKDNRFQLSAVVPFGQSEIHVGGEQSKYTNTGVSNKINHFSAAYVYNLSKRTAMYATVSQLKNGSASKNVLDAGGAGAMIAGGKSKGFDVGLRHIF